MSVYYYRVQQHKKHWWHRTWQAEWDNCLWAQRGYTRLGVSIFVATRRKWSWFDRVLIRYKILIKLYITDRGWYKTRYDALGRSTFEQGKNV